MNDVMEQIKTLSATLDEETTHFGREALLEYLEGYEGRLMRALKSLLGSRDDAPEEVARRIRIGHAAKRHADLRYFEVIASALLKRHRLAIRNDHRLADLGRVEVGAAVQGKFSG